MIRARLVKHGANPPPFQGGVRGGSDRPQPYQDAAHCLRLAIALGFVLAWPGAITPSFADEPATAGKLTRLKYNNPGLVVDLGVGLWAWPVPCDADGDGDFDLIVSCPDKPSNGIWLFENTTGDTARDKFPVFQPARRLSKAVHYVMPSYVDGQLRVLTPGQEYPDFLQTGLDRPVALAVPQPIHTPRGTAPQARGTKIRHNQWRYVDYDGDGTTDLVVGIEDWSDYGWDDAWDAQGLAERSAARLCVLAAQRGHDSGTGLRCAGARDG